MTGPPHTTVFSHLQHQVQDKDSGQAGLRVPTKKMDVGLLKYILTNETTSITLHPPKISQLNLNMMVFCVPNIFGISWGCWVFRLSILDPKVMGVWTSRWCYIDVDSHVAGARWFQGGFKCFLEFSPYLGDDVHVQFWGDYFVFR